MFWKPGEPLPPADFAAHFSPAQYNPHRHLSLQEQRRRLPIWSYRLALLHAIEHHRVVVLVGSTGCGKSTQIPQYLREAGWTKNGMTIVVTSSRRLACSSNAARIAEELNEEIGQTVGYSIHFDSNMSPKECEIAFMTDELLVKELMYDPLLTKYSVIMLDDAHDRTLYTEMLLILLRKILRKRRSLRLVIASATMDAEVYASYFRDVVELDDDALVPKKRRVAWDKDPVEWEKEKHKSEGSKAVVAGEMSLLDVCVLGIPGRVYPVTIHYLGEPTANYLKACVDTVMQLRKASAGDILVFVTGADEVYDVLNAIREQDDKLFCVPLFAFLPRKDQLAAFARKTERKVIVSTNFAETAITLPGIRYVVDCCLAKTEAFDPRTGTTHYEISPCSLATLAQRAGRAGRMESGSCYRLMSGRDVEKLSKQSVPEILRSNLAHFVLHLKCLGVDKIAGLDFIAQPTAISFESALEDLFLLGALDEEAKLSPLGLQMAACPLPPLWAKLLLNAPKFDCASEVCLIASMGQIHSPFVAHRNKERLLAARQSLGVFEGDLVSLLNVARQYEQYRHENPGWATTYMINTGVMERVLQVSAHLEAFLESYGFDGKSTCGDDVTALQKCICESWYSQAAKICEDGGYRPLRNMRGRSYKLHPNCILGGLTDIPEYVVYEQTVAWAGQYFMKNVTAVDVRWLIEAAPHFYKEAEI